MGDVVGVMVGGRQSGKTSALIRMAHETDQYIVVPTLGMARSTFRQARDMGMPIRMPVSLGECLTGRLDRTPYAALHPAGGVLVDEAQEVLRMVLHLPRIDVMVVGGGRVIDLARTEVGHE